MDIGDVTDPNLDGDFQALVEVRQVSSHAVVQKIDKTRKQIE
jgi:hypothetical protein